MHFLITNDDGIGEPGLAALAKIASQWGKVTVVAPDRCWSGCGHQTTTARPIRTEQKEAGWYSCDGAPADCVRLGLTKICPGVDWVLSGINPGGNLGVDMVMSGTVAAAREAMYLGKRAIAFSQYRLSKAVCDWERATEYATRVLSQILANENPARGFWNANFPDGIAHVPQIMPTKPDPNPLLVGFEETDNGFVYRSSYHHRPRNPGSDVDICFGGNISLTFVDG